MESWDSFTPSPDMKLEASPAESFLSVPGEMYPSLFSASNTLNPLEIMSPSSDMKAEAETPSALATVPEEEESTESPAAAGDKKPTKKRKSWGQVLPEPKTNLPPRKRAKTEDEKEQRRVERVLRNRRAAQSSRERKRQEVEALEKRNKELENHLEDARRTNMLLLQQLKAVSGGSAIVSRPTSIDSLHPNAVTFSQPLFGSQGGHGSSLVEQGNPSLDSLFTMSSESNKTVNPASLSPALTPVPDQTETTEPATTAAPAAEATTNEQTSPDLTQHPAEVLCPDLQCQSAEVPRSWTASQQPLSPALALYCQLTLLLASTSTMISICRRPLTQIAMSLKAGFSLPPTQSILNTIIWLVTQSSRASRRQTRSTSTSTNTSTTRRQTSSPATPSPASQLPRTRRPSTLRLRLLRKILTCSPILARPLLDATMEVLRLVRFEETLAGLDRVGRDDGSNATAEPGCTGNVQLDGRWLPGAALPSMEVLLTLAWALKVEIRRMSNREGPDGTINTTKTMTASPSRPGVSSSVVIPMTTTTSKELYSLKTRKRARVDFEEAVIASGAGKRRCRRRFGQD